MPGAKYQPDDVMGRLSSLEAWAEGIDRWRDDKAELDTNRHRENREALHEISQGLLRRDTLTDDNDRERLEKLDGIEAQLKMIALQTARDEGARDQRSKIFGGFGQVILAAISGGALLEIGRYFNTITRWFWPPPR